MTAYCGARRENTRFWHLQTKEAYDAVWTCENCHGACRRWRRYDGFCEPGRCERSVLPKGVLRETWAYRVQRPVVRPAYWQVPADRGQTRQMLIMTLHRVFPLTMLAVASAAFFLNPVPAEAACPSGYFQCIKGGKAHSPRRCCPIARPAATPALPLSRCKSAVREAGPNGSVKIRCTRWSALLGEAPATHAKGVRST
jgi:hypothetical protein